MSPFSRQIVDLVDVLPEEEQNFAYEFVKRLVLAWDPDFVKVTASEAEAIAQGRAEIERGEYVRLDDLKFD